MQLCVIEELAVDTFEFSGQFGQPLGEFNPRLRCNVIETYTCIQTQLHCVIKMIAFKMANLAPYE